MTLPTFSSCFFSCFNLRCYLVLLGFFTYRLRFVGSVVVVVQASIDLYLVFFFYPVIQINAQPTNGFLPVSLFFFFSFYSQVRTSSYSISRSCGSWRVGRHGPLTGFIFSFIFIFVLFFFYSETESPFTGAVAASCDFFFLLLLFSLLFYFFFCLRGQRGVDRVKPTRPNKISTAKG